MKHVMELITDAPLKISVQAGDCETTLHSNAASSHKVSWSACLRSQVSVCVDATEAPQTDQTILAAVKSRIQEHRRRMEKETDKRSKLQNKTDSWRMRTLMNRSREEEQGYEGRPQTYKEIRKKNYTEAKTWINKH